MNAMVVKQLLIASGVKDPAILATIDRVMEEKWENPSVDTLDGEVVLSGEGGAVTRVRASSPGAKLTIFLVCEKTT